MKIAFIGGGRIVRILLEGLKRADKLPENISVYDKDEKALEKLKKFPVKTGTDNKKAAEAEIIFLAVHPPNIGSVLQEIKESLKRDTIIVSLAPKVTIKQIRDQTRSKKIVRIIPNAPSIINKGYNPITFSKSIKTKEKEKLLEILEPLGEFPEVDENKLEAYAVITAMGPTYFWFQFIELEKLAKSFGMDADEAKKAIEKMVKGAVDVLYHSQLKRDEILDLIPVKPLGESEAEIKSIYKNKLDAIFKQLKG
ncbi:MAG TPA: NAD(P)-binding domain-containing protein [Methanothermobacter sp.]|nr:pyrroline-5-carboxylate reductase [Methanothermobacter sp. MT-2]HHW05349.1 NAD(P)-binding domain-containing protein [Methanothermobacter sp.]HOK73104.1 NAD(P)-binding domain-containing protein [Methanothermobacter sp.]HOL68736.1 NAD(P)-binding domain-containing protein [Methanothermobacter sp.]HPQ04629.1 NAD(P)-binding domain-containing protein [Methanothermobacter sp.]